MSNRMRTLTPSEMEKLPHCRWSWDSHAKCFEDKPPTETKFCVRCCMEELLNVLVHPDGQPDGVQCLDGLAAMLKELKVLE